MSNKCEINRMTHQNWKNRSVKVMVFNATLSNSSAMSLRSVLLVEDTGLPGVKLSVPVASHWQTLSHNVVSTTPRHERDPNWSAGCTDSCQFTYHKIATTTIPANPRRTEYSAKDTKHIRQIMTSLCYFFFIHI
jgi:hypothetical protein